MSSELLSPRGFLQSCDRLVSPRILAVPRSLESRALSRRGLAKQVEPRGIRFSALQPLHSLLRVDELSCPASHQAAEPAKVLPSLCNAQRRRHRKPTSILVFYRRIRHAAFAIGVGRVGSSHPLSAVTTLVCSSLRGHFQVIGREAETSREEEPEGCGKTPR